MSAKSIARFHETHPDRVIVDHAESFESGPSLRQRLSELDPFQWGETIEERTGINAMLFVYRRGESRDVQHEPDYPFADNH